MNGFPSCHFNRSPNYGLTPIRHLKTLRKSIRHDLFQRAGGRKSGRSGLRSIDPIQEDRSAALKPRCARFDRSDRPKPHPNSSEASWGISARLRGYRVTAYPTCSGSVGSPEAPRASPEAPSRLPRVTRGCFQPVGEAFALHLLRERAKPQIGMQAGLVFAARASAARRTLPEGGEQGKARVATLRRFSASSPGGRACPA